MLNTAQSGTSVSQQPNATQAARARTREARHAVLLAQRPSDTVRVHLRDDDLVLRVRIRIRELLVHRSKVLAARRVSPGMSETVCAEA